MKNAFAILSLVIAIGGVLSPTIALADTRQDQLQDQRTRQSAQDTFDRTDPRSTATPERQAELQRQYAQDQQTIQNQGGADIISSFFGAASSVVFGIIARILAWIAEIVIWVLAAILGLIAFLAEFVVRETVLEMGKYITDTSAQAGIATAWRVVRDLANIGIIGGLIAISIGTIIQSSSFSAEKLLGRIIVAALLVNFSYFIAGVVIDASNFSASIIYKNITSPEGSCAGALSGSYLGGAGSGIARDVGASDAPCTLMVRYLALTKFEDWRNIDFVNLFKERVTGTGGTAVADWLTFGFISYSVQLLVFNVMLIIMLGITVYVFIQLIAMLVARFVALVFVLVTSPIGIAGSAIPKLESYSKEWWEALWSQAFFAPVFFLLIGLALQMLESVVPILHGQISGNQSTALSSVGIIITFMLATAFMYMSLTVAKQMADRAKRFSELYKATDKYIGKPLYGIALQYPLGAMYRNSVGRLGEMVQIKYNNRLAPLVRKYVPFGDTADRMINESLKSIEGSSVLGTNSFLKERDAKKAREVEVSAREKEMRKRDTARDAARRRQTAEAKYNKEFKYGNRKQKTDAAGRLLYWKTDENGVKKLTHEKTDEAAMESMIELQQRLEKETGLRDARVDLQTALADLPAGTIERWFKEEPHLLTELAAGMSSEQYLEAMSSKEIPTKVKGEMRKIRHGQYMDLVRNLQRDVDNGTVLEGGDEYNDRVGQIFEYAKKVVRNKDEFLDLIVSDTGKDMRKMRVLWHGSTNGMYLKSQESTKIGESEKQGLRRLKRKSYLRHIQAWSGAEIIKGRGGDLPYVPGDNMDAQEEARKWAEATERHAQAVLENEESSANDRRVAKRFQRFAQLVRSGRKYEELSDEDKKIVDEIQQESYDEMPNWYQGKEADEVATEMQDRQLYHPLTARGIKIGQMMAIKQDQRFLDKLRNNVLIYGDDDVIKELMLNDNVKEKYGMPTSKELEMIERRRAELGVGTLADAIARAKKASGEE